MASGRYAKRLQKELQEIQKSPPHGIMIEEANNLDRWVVQITGTENTLYNGEKFRLQFRFNSEYPLESPEVMFIGVAPIHPHIYSNGHICLSILYDAWSPALTVSSVCVSILSMLSSCTEKVPPVDNQYYVSRSIGKTPKDTRWMFHDDTV
ncbi:Rab GTPase [Tieghemostelium lacteum]|uniref:N-terminal E2 ubiquitin-conjugating enzyme n=1 Tax=Tieghemostelium lacteum TaxID=361077 RepID=A0A151ZDL3_TIELA|nr:Rab GTPase [Tieghemostelium lacteum]|eukprot:KYQ92043.1 Rab GTPase [Tieghemostelium lacteum]